VGRFLLAIALLAVVSCQNETHAVFTPVPSPSPHTEPTAAILQSADAPAGLNVCAGSGPIDVYLTVLVQSDATLAGREAEQWLALRSQGAQSGAISIFAAKPAACSAELGATRAGQAVTSIVVRFPDAAQANRAWASGVFGFPPPPTGEVATGVTVGTSTGLGASSFTYDRPSVRLACWQRSMFVALVVASNLDLASFKAATAAIDPRLN
jgi:hypothetical protein